MTFRTRLFIFGLIFTLLLQIPQIVIGQQNNAEHITKLYKVEEREISFSIPLGDKLIFMLSSLNDYQLMVTDGTKEGTHPLGNFYRYENPYHYDNLKFPPIANGNLYFAAAENENDQVEVWKTDGTVSGTKMVANIHPTESSVPINFRAFQDKIFFKALDTFETGNTPFYQLFSLDENDQLESYPLDHQQISDFEVWNNSIYVNAVSSGGVYKLDIQSKTYELIVNMDFLTEFEPTGMGLFILGRKDRLDDIYEALYKIDKNGEFSLVKDFFPGGNDFTSVGSTHIVNEEEKFLREANGRLYLFASLSNDEVGFWSTDGTEAGTKLHYKTDNTLSFRNLVTHSGSVLFSEQYDLNDDGYFDGDFLVEFDPETDQIAPVKIDTFLIGLDFQDLYSYSFLHDRGYIKLNESLILPADLESEKTFAQNLPWQLIEFNTTTREARIIVPESTGIDKFGIVNTVGDKLFFSGSDDETNFLDSDLFVINSSNFGMGPSSGPAVVSLNSPADASTGISRVPKLQWDEAKNALNYRLQLSSVSDFTSTVFDTTVTATIFEVDNSLKGEAQYFWRVQSLKNELKADWSQTWSFTTKGADTDTVENTKVAAEFSLSFGEASNPQDYRLIALPGQVDESLKSLFNGSHGIDWQAFWDDGSDEDYLVKYDGSQTFSMAPGNGFWVTSTDSITYSDTLDAVELNRQNQVAIPLHEGWNIISNPLDIDVPWSTVSSANGDSLQPVWGFEESFEEMTDFISAKTGKAFYFLNDQGLDELVIPYEESTEKGKDKTETKGLILTTFVDGIQTSSSRIIFVDRKTKSDVDVIAPPSAFEGSSLRLTSKKPDLKRSNTLARMYRIPDPQGQKFDLRLNAELGKPVTIKLSGWSRSMSAEAVLIDQATGVSYDLKDPAGITFTPEKEATQFSFVIGGGQYLENEMDQFLPKQINVLPNYPNPFNPTTTLQFALPEQAEVRVQVYDIIGRQVATLINDQVREAGIHSVTFDASRQASGLYFAVFEIGQQRFIQKMMLIK